MSASASLLRRLALRLLKHALWVLPGERSTWADAMRNELQHLDDDREAFRWAAGCVLAGYWARFTSSGSNNQWVRWELTRARGRSRFIWGMCLSFSCSQFLYYSGVLYYLGSPVHDAPLYIWVLFTVPMILFVLMLGYLVGVWTWSHTERRYESWQRGNRKS